MQSPFITGRFFYVFERRKVDNLSNCCQVKIYENKILKKGGEILMTDSRETAQKKKNGQPLPQAPKSRDRGVGSPPGHLTDAGTISNDAYTSLPRDRRVTLKQLQKDRQKPFWVNRG